MTEQTETGSRHRHVERVGRDLEGWLARPDWTLEEAYDWLQGHRLPPVGHDEDVFMWLLEGLLYADERAEAEAELARRLALVLGERPDVTRPGLRPEELLYNLFMLCAGLGRPEVLGRPLLAVYERRELNGRWMGANLRGALTAALIPNQLDKGLLPIWLSMIEQRTGRGGDGFLVGGLAHGIDGVTFLPAAEPGEPPLEEIGEAFRVLSERLKDDPDRRPEFEQYIERVVARYVGRPTWEEELLRLADKCDWPDWALVSLPSLCVEVGYPPPGVPRRLLVWQIYLPLFSEFGSERGFNPEIGRGLCRGKIFETALPADAAEYIAPFTSLLEERRLPRNTPLASYKAVVGAVTDRMWELVLLLKAKIQSGSKPADTAQTVTVETVNRLSHAHIESVSMNNVGMAAEKAA